ncbi:uncharacterized protein BXZ73DRAFT_91534 [Epithele typhae]|uniref:uncharacterized protein n=1 Tax=Epithele typhae TaxID=378194 RepID=UPI0020081476|nr:uncharacterized protein BXZ73DRAFT_91534 [Epithele typhae]KAH9922814.1 hypothetical protein BXZ73DRAFT_91534 [Epithele typhae]
MSTGHPYPVSHNRASYSASASYPSASTPSSAYPYPSYSARSPSYDASHARPDPAASYSSLSGTFHHAEHDPASSQHYPGSARADAYAQPHQPHPREQLWQYAPPVEAPRARLEHPALEGSPTREYQHHPHHGPLSSHAAPLAGPGRSPTSGRRRDKARLELAADQPLTTQGKQRTRVYVACVQCRGRKIRCDGAKPVCHNCSRRSENPQLCNYDAAPKRRGPDRVPGARQRGIPGQTGERPPRRRRRPPPPDAAGYGAAGSVSASASPVDVKSVHFSPTSPGAYMADAAGQQHQHQHQHATEHIPSISGHGQYGGRHRQDIPELVGRSALPGGLGTHYAQHHDFSTVYPGGGARTSHEYLVPVPEIGVMTETYAYGVGAAPEAARATTTRRQEREEDDDQKIVIAEDPGLQFTRETWWDALLSLYAHRDGGGGDPFDVTLTIPADVRETATQNITADLRSIFHTSPHWLSFLNLPRFFGALLDPRTRDGVQPSLILGALALATFLKSHEMELGAAGRARSLRLRDQAQSALEASLNSRWLDHSLVQAAWLLAFFEVCAHPLHSTARVRSSMGLLDSLIRSMKLMSLDAEDPRATAFASSVPAVPAEDHDRLAAGVPEGRQGSGCHCARFTLGHTWPMVREFAPLWNMTPTWQSSWTEADIRKEECRRLVWSSVGLTASHSSYTAAGEEMETQQMFLMDPRNCRLLFPGESLTHADDAPAVPPPDKESVWALQVRTMLLWNSCVRLRAEPDALADADKTRFAAAAWAEAEAIEDALGAHACGIERAYLFQGRELLFNARTFIAYELQEWLPRTTVEAHLVFYRRKAEEWLTSQAMLAQRLLNAGLHVVTGLPSSDLARRPFFLFWFMSQIERALRLWAYDRSLVLSLEVAKALSRPVQYLMTLWPCPEQQRRWSDLRDKLNGSCYAASVPGLSPYISPLDELPHVPPSGL